MKIKYEMDTEKLIEAIVKECKWRKNVGGVDICSGMCAPCKRIIETGKCDTLIELFGKGKEE